LVAYRRLSEYGIKYATLETTPNTLHYLVSATKQQSLYTSPPTA
jgi:hypothetical protein